MEQILQMTKPILTKEQIAKQIAPIPMARIWKDFLGELPIDSQITMLVHGPSHGGKTSFMLKLAKEWGLRYPVLYVNAEEEIGGGTLEVKLRQFKFPRSRFEKRKGVYFTNHGNNGDNNLDNIIKWIDTGFFKYVIFDSATKLARINNCKLKEIVDLAENYRTHNINFASILFTTKDQKNYKGDSDLKYDAEMTIRVDNLIADCKEKNRYKFDKNNMEVDIRSLP